ncbi:MAG: VanZ family protein [Deltaproteobacteria bacterium]|nr:VanZ family protein [Deltaproteobacteria bacterium]
MAGGIFYVSSLEKVDLPLSGISFNDLLFHAAAYFLFGITLIIAAYPWYPEGGFPRRIHILLVVIGILYGVSDEIHQAFVPNRTCTLSDLAADSFGVLLSQFAGKWGLKKFRGGRSGS